MMEGVDIKELMKKTISKSRKITSMYKICCRGLMVEDFFFIFWSLLILNFKNKPFQNLFLKFEPFMPAHLTRQNNTNTPPTMAVTVLSYYTSESDVTK